MSVKGSTYHQLFYFGQIAFGHDMVKGGNRVVRALFCLLSHLGALGRLQLPQLSLPQVQGFKFAIQKHYSIWTSGSVSPNGNTGTVAHEKKHKISSVIAVSEISPLCDHVMHPGYWIFIAGL